MARRSQLGQFCPQAPDLAVDVLQLCLGLLFADVSVAVAGPGECLDFAAEQSQPRVPGHRGLAVLQRARVYRVVDLVLVQPELLAGGLVAQRCDLALPFFVWIVQLSILMTSAGGMRPGGVPPPSGYGRPCRSRPDR